VLMFLLYLVLLRQFIFELAEVDDLAHRRSGTGNNFYQVRVAFTSHHDRFARLHHPQLTPVLVYDPYLGCTDFLIDAVTLLFADG
jgi:hypothetical protein